MDKRISRDSVEELAVEVFANTFAGSPIDPTGYPVEVAVLAATVTDPAEGDFKPATWGQGPRSKMAVVMVGAGTDVGALTPGTYRAWVRVTATPRVPVLRTDAPVVVY